MNKLIDAAIKKMKTWTNTKIERRVMDLEVRIEESFEAVRQDQLMAFNNEKALAQGLLDIRKRVESLEKAVTLLIAKSQAQEKLGPDAKAGMLENGAVTKLYAIPPDKLGEFISKVMNGEDPDSLLNGEHNRNN
jgi:hypothetical protein